MCASIVLSSALLMLPSLPARISRREGGRREGGESGAVGVDWAPWSAHPVRSCSVKMKRSFSSSVPRHAIATPTRNSSKSMLLVCLRSNMANSRSVQGRPQPLARERRGGRATQARRRARGLTPKHARKREEAKKRVLVDCLPRRPLGEILHGRRESAHKIRPRSALPGNAGLPVLLERTLNVSLSTFSSRALTKMVGGPRVGMKGDARGCRMRVPQVSVRRGRLTVNLGVPGALSRRTSICTLLKLGKVVFARSVAHSAVQEERQVTARARCPCAAATPVVGVVAPPPGTKTDDG